mgnify:CR=1 FL=1
MIIARIVPGDNPGAMATNAPRWDVFCRVVDNFGDAGFCWRLARMLAVTHGLDVTLRIDRIDALARIVAGIDADRADQRIDGVRVVSFDAADAMRLYRESFKPSPSHVKPYAILATHVVCADSDEEADRLARTVDLNFVRRAKGEYLPLASPEEATAYDYAPVDRARIASNRQRMSIGSPATVKARLAPLIEATQAQELMVTTMIHDHAARKHSYELLAGIFA